MRGNWRVQYSFPFVVVKSPNTLINSRGFKYKFQALEQSCELSIKYYTYKLDNAAKKDGKKFRKKIKYFEKKLNIIREDNLEFFI